MRSYPRNSPQAAARIVALALLGDGHLCKVELDALDRCGVQEQLGLRPGELHAVIHAFCEDLLATSSSTWGAACAIDGGTLAGLMAEIDDTSLRRKVFGLCVEAVDADRHLGEGESLILEAAIRQWDLHREAKSGTCSS
jgi:hypothetical protein